MGIADPDADPPEELVQATRDLPWSDRRLLIKRLIRAPGSPLSRIHLVHLLVHCGNDTAIPHRLAKRVIATLMSPTGVAEADAFLSILSWVGEEFAYWPDARHWPPHIGLAMVWAHAHRLTAIFSCLGAPFSLLRDEFHRMTRRLSLGILQRDPVYLGDVAHPGRVSSVKMLLTSLAYGIGEVAVAYIDKRLRDQFTGLAFPHGGQAVLPDPSLLRDQSHAKDCLNSFLGGDLGERLMPLLGAERARQFTRQTLRALAEWATNALEDSSDSGSAWLLIAAVFGDLPPAADLAQRLGTVIRETDFVRLLKKDATLAFRAMQTASVQLTNLADEDARCHLRDELVRITESLADLEANRSVCNGALKDYCRRPEETCPLLVEVAWGVSLSVQPPRDVCSEFAGLLAQLLDLWPSMMPFCRPAVQRLCEELPIAQAQQFWPVLLRLRAE